MALYELYYSPLIEGYAPARDRLEETGRHADRPLTWVPLVFHCTEMKNIPGIFHDGVVAPGNLRVIARTSTERHGLDEDQWAGTWCDTSSGHGRVPAAVHFTMSLGQDDEFVPSTSSSQ